MINSHVAGALSATLVGFFTLTSHADLTPKLDGQVVYDNDKDITWVADANLAASMPLILDGGLPAEHHDKTE